MIEYKIEDFSVMHINGKNIDLNYKIEKVFDRGNMLIVLLGETDPGKEDYSVSQPYNGIYAFSPEGEYLWNIEVFFRPGHELNNVKVLPIYRFIDADIDENGNLVVHTDMGIGYILDIDKKQIIGYFKSKKRPINRREHMIPYFQPSETVLEVNGRKLDFSYSIKRIIEINDILIVSLDSTSRGSVEQLENGVYAVSSDGEILWNIEEFFRPGNARKYGSPIELYQSVALDDDGRYLKVSTYNGIKFTLDIEKMKVIKRAED